MIEKVTLQMSGNGKFRTENGTGCDAMNPKTLMLYAAAQCSAQTALMIMQKERITPKRFEISYSGDLSAETVQSESYCGMVQMLRRIAPVSREIAVVSTQPAKA